MDWDHLRFFAALAQAGSLAGAARMLGVEHTTVARRLQALEKIMGQTLFVRQKGGLTLTQAGQQLLPAVQAMEKAVRGVEQVALPDGADEAHPAGLVRVGVTEGLGTVLLSRQLALLAVRYPQLSIDLLALPRLLHLSRREADIVISLERPKRGSVVVSKLTDYHLYLYGERQYLARRPWCAAATICATTSSCITWTTCCFPRNCNCWRSFTGPPVSCFAAPALPRSTRPCGPGWGWRCCPPSWPTATPPWRGCCPSRPGLPAPSG